MIIYIEQQVKDYPQTQKVLKMFPNADIVWIKNYKNIFDKNLWWKVEKSFILAKLTGSAVLKAPDAYGHNDKTAYFFKTSIGCVFDCSYCYLKWAFKNEIPVYFLNYEDIKQEIRKVVSKRSEEITEELRRENKISRLGQDHRIKTVLQDKRNLEWFRDWIETENKGIGTDFGTELGQKIGGIVTDNKRNLDWIENDYELKLKQNIDYKDKIWFYSSDYSDILWMDMISWFMQEFVPFFEKLENTMMEIRTKSSNIKPILNLWFIPENTEFAFSLNPQELIDKYEIWTSSLESRIQAINTLLEKWYKVWLRFLPLLPVKNYQEIYTKFVDEILEKIPVEKVSSTFVSGLLYTKADYKTMLKKYPDLDILYYLQEDDDYFVRESRKVRDFFYNLFRKIDRKCFICLDK